MPEKRPYPEGQGQNGDAKRSRSINGSPAPASMPNGGGAVGSPLSEADRKKAEVAERIAAMKAKIAGQAKPAAVPSSVSSTANAVEDAKARIAAMKARLNAGAAITPSPSPGPRTPPQSGASRSPPAAQDRQGEAQAQLAALKARAAEQQYFKMRGAAPPPTREDNSGKVRGGLGIGLHPALMGNVGRPVGKDGTREQQGAKQPETVNPYLDSASSATQDAVDGSAFDARLGKSNTARKSRAMIFNQKGKFIAQAEALRTQERLEKLKQEMQEQARKKAIEEATERSYLVQAPPDIEWWDEGLVEGSSYENVDEPGGIKFDAITEYIQHPVLLEPPQEKLMPAPKPVPLTEKERKKQRRQRRMEDHKEEQAKIRLGLIPPPPPKVKKSNLMRVLGQEAVKDPTAVEARVNREIAERADKHEETNEARRLTREQRHEKLAAQQEGDAARGLRVAVFRVESLSYGKHRFQVDRNAQQNKLTGMVVLHPKMNLVVVEGGAHSVSAYKKLMLNRIKWTENAAPLDRGADGEAGGEGSRRDADKEREEKEWLQSLDQQGRLKDLSFNRCTLVWEGEEKQRAFRKWGNRVCETDGEAKDALARMKMENMWTLAQSLRVE